MICPTCNKDTLSEEPREIAREICKENGINGELCNPGGRQLRFSKKQNQWLQISDHCGWCDLEDIKNFFK
jgi:hypothetical protein